MSRFLLSEAIGAAESLQIPVVSATGGEPFLWPEGIRYFIDLAAKRNVKWRIVTNGFWGKGLSPSIEKVLDDMEKAGGGGLSISVDRYHAEFVPLLHIQAASNQCINRNIPVELNFTIDRHPSTLHILREIAGWGIPIALASVSSVGRASEIDRKLLFEQLRLGGCDTIESPFLRWDGLVTACCGANRAMFENNSSKLVLGNATKTPLTELLATHDTPLTRALKNYGPYFLAQRQSALVNACCQNNLNYDSDNFCKLCVDLTKDVESLFLDHDAINPEEVKNDYPVAIQSEGINIEQSIECIHLPHLSQGNISGRDHLAIAGLIAFRSENGQEYQMADKYTLELLDIAKHEGWEGVIRTVGGAMNKPQALQAYMASIAKLQRTGIFQAPKKADIEI